MEKPPFKHFFIRVKKKKKLHCRQRQQQRHFREQQQQQRPPMIYAILIILLLLLDPADEKESPRCYAGSAAHASSIFLPLSLVTARANRKQSNGAPRRERPVSGERGITALEKSDDSKKGGTHVVTTNLSLS